MGKISCKCFDEISIGDKCIRQHTVSKQDVLLFASVSGDQNPVHLDADYAATTVFGGQIVHGMFSGALISAALAMELPGPGTIYLGQTLSFRKPVRLGDALRVLLEVTTKHTSKPIVTLQCTVTNQDGKVVVDGTATVMAPTEKITVEAAALPHVQFN